MLTNVSRWKIQTCIVLSVLVFVASALAEPPGNVAEAQGKTKNTDRDNIQLPPALTHYMGREIARTMHFDGARWLVRESREREEECSTLLKVLKLKPGQNVCDLGCGNGFYTLQMAPMVQPGGQVWAVDIQPEMLTLLRERAKDVDVDNLKPILGTLIDPHLPEGKMDLIFCVDVYHEFSHPVHMLRAMRKSLAPNGRLVLVEFRSEDPDVPIKKLHKMSKAQVLKELIPNGFKLVEEFDKLPWQHVMFFERDEDWDPVTGPLDKAASTGTKPPATEDSSP